MPRKPQFGRIYHPKKKRPDGARVEIRTWWVAYYVNGSQTRESSKSQKYKDAENLLRRRIAELETGVYAGPAAERVKVTELLDELIEDSRTMTNPSHGCGTLLGTYDRSSATCGRQGVQTKHLKACVKKRRAEGISNSTINRELARLKRAFNLSRESTPPKVKQVPVFPRLEEAPPRKGFFEHDEFVVLRLELPEHLRPVITFAYSTGCRKGEILWLRWDQVDLLARIVRLEPGETKNDEPRTIPLAGELYQMLVLQKQVRDQKWPDCPWVFFRYGKRIKDFRGAWEEASKRAGLWNDETDKPKHIFHDLRRTGARNLVRAGVPERVVMAIGGWKTRSVFDRYNIVNERDLHEAAAKLERHLAELEKAREGATSGQLSDSGEMRGRKLLN